MHIGLDRERAGLEIHVRGDAGDGAGDGGIRECVGSQLDRLAHANVGRELLGHVRGEPQRIEADEPNHWRLRVHVLSFRHHAFGDDAVERRADHGVLEIARRAVERGFLRDEFGAQLALRGDGGFVRRGGGLQVGLRRSRSCREMRFFAASACAAIERLLFACARFAAALRTSGVWPGGGSRPASAPSFARVCCSAACCSVARYRSRSPSRRTSGDPAFTLSPMSTATLATRPATSALTVA